EAELYDVTAWSIPLQYNVETHACADDPTGSLDLVSGSAAKPGTLANPNAAYGYVAPWGSTAAVRLIAAPLREAIGVGPADVAFSHNGKAYPAGSLIFRKSETPDLAQKLQRLAASTGADIAGVDDSWVTQGPSFGSDRVAMHHAPRIAIAWDAPT